MPECFDLKIYLYVGSEVIIETFSLHMNEKYWKEPEQFRPERFQVLYVFFVSRKLQSLKFSGLEGLIFINLLLEKNY